MPTFKYRCRKCLKEWEVIQKITDKPITEHRSCGGIADRLIQPVSISFKGKGFHGNDYKS